MRAWEDRPIKVRLGVSDVASKRKENLLGKMNFSEILNLMAEYARQMVLLQIVEDVVDFLKQSDLRFFDLLQALAKYAVRERDKDPDENPTWEVVGRYLLLSLEELKTLFHTGSGEILPLNELSLLKMQSDYFRQLLMLQMVTLWTQALENEQYRFSDLLKALSHFAVAETENEEDPERRKSWGIVAGLLKVAAEEAERKGKELP